MSGYYTELRVLCSAAGYYIGTNYVNIELDGSTWEEPGSRESGYFRTREAAEAALAAESEEWEDE